MGKGISISVHTGSLRYAEDQAVCNELSTEGPAAAVAQFLASARQERFKAIQSSFRAFAGASHLEEWVDVDAVVLTVELLKGWWNSKSLTEPAASGRPVKA